LYVSFTGKPTTESEAPAVHIVPLDVTDLASHQAAVDTVFGLYGHVDILVLNAGASQRNAAIDTPFSVTQNLMNLNFLSLVALNKLVLPSMVERKSGKIVVMSSLSGILGTPAASSYSASKFALVSSPQQVPVCTSHYNLSLDCVFSMDISMH
jgi:short-subunit dehydrogenase